MLSRFLDLAYTLTPIFPPYGLLASDPIIPIKTNPFDLDISQLGQTFNGFGYGLWMFPNQFAEVLVADLREAPRLSTKIHTYRIDA